MSRQDGFSDPPSRCHPPSLKSYCGTSLLRCLSVLRSRSATEDGGEDGRSLLPLSKETGFRKLNLRRITDTPHSALLPHTTAGSVMRCPRSKSGIFDLHLTPCWCPWLPQNPLSLAYKQRFDDGFWISVYLWFSIELFYDDYLLWRGYR